MDQDPIQTPESKKSEKPAILHEFDSDGNIISSTTGTVMHQKEGSAGVDLLYFVSPEMGVPVRSDDPRLEFIETQNTDTATGLGGAAMLEERLGHLPERTEIVAPAKMIEQNVDNMQQNLNDLKERTVLVSEELKAGPQTYFHDADLRDLQSKLAEIVSSISNANIHAMKVLADADLMTNKSEGLVAKTQELRNLNETYSNVTGNGWLARVLDVLDRHAHELDTGNEDALRSELTGLVSYYLPEIDEFIAKLR